MYNIHLGYNRRTKQFTLEVNLNFCKIYVGCYFYLLSSYFSLMNIYFLNNDLVQIQIFAIYNQFNNFFLGFFC